MSKNKRDPEQELRNRTIFKAIFYIAFGALVVTTFVLIYQAIPTAIARFESSIVLHFGQKVLDDIRKAILGLCVIGIFSFFAGTFAYFAVYNAQRVDELKAIIEGEATHEEQA